MSTVSYQHQPGIHATRGAVPECGTEHPYRVTKILWPEKVEAFISSLLIGRTLHVCCGKSRLGTVRLDIDPENRPDIVCDAADMRSAVNDAAFDTVLCDPPYNGKMQWQHDLLRELLRVASKRIVFQHWFIPVDDAGRYKKAVDGWGLTAVHVWMPRTYFGRVQAISVFDRDNRQPDLFDVTYNAAAHGQASGSEPDRVQPLVGQNEGELK